MRRNALIVALFLLIQATAELGAQEAYKHETSYQGPRLLGEAFVCTADRQVVAGFYNNVTLGSVQQSISVVKPVETATWRISVKSGSATVRSFSGPQKLETSVTFSIERTATGLILISKRPTRSSPEIITIDLTNASFVYSNQHVNQLFNRAAIWHGSCRPSP